jgi:hypothetical protein
MNKTLVTVTTIQYTNDYYSIFQRPFSISNYNKSVSYNWSYIYLPDSNDQSKNILANMQAGSAMINSQLSGNFIQ